MSIDALQVKMKKLGNTLMVDLSLYPEQVPAKFLQENDPALACLAYGRELLTALKGEVPAVRFRLLTYALLGEKGLSALEELTKLAASLGYYILLDLPGLSSGEESSYAAQKIWGDGSRFQCDAVLISGYFGSDAVKPFLPYVKEQKKDLFVICRSATRSSAEIQDLLAGSRTVHLAAADYVNRYSSDTVGKFGFSRVGILASATSGDSIRMLRTKYPQLFILIDGLECSGANAKNCSNGVNRLGHGAIVCVGTSVTCAWKEKEGEDYAACAVEAVRKTQKKLDRYFTVL